MRQSMSATPAIRNLVKHAQQLLIQRGVSPIQQRAGIPAIDTSDLGFASEIETLAPLVEEQLLITRFPNARRSPFLTRLLRVQEGAVGYPVGDRKSIPTIRGSMDPAGLLPFKFAGDTVVTQESLQLGGAVFERGVQGVLVGALANIINACTLSSDAESSDAPAGLAYGVSPLVATDDPVADVRALIAALRHDADLASCVFVTDAVTASVLGTVTGADGGLLFPNVGITGGELLGAPLLVTRASPREGSPETGSLYLIDGSAIDFALDGIDLAVGKHATIEMDSSPTGDGDTPAAASQKLVNMWVNSLECLRMIARASWKVARPGSVAVLSGIEYAAE